MRPEKVRPGDKGEISHWLAGDRMSISKCRPLRPPILCWGLVLGWMAVTAFQATAGSLVPEPQPVQVYIFRQRLWLVPSPLDPSPKQPVPAAPAAAARPATARLAALITKYAKKHGLDPGLVHLVIQRESGYRPDAVSPKGALGLMQLLPATAAELGVTDPFDVEQNLDGGLRYLKQCLRRFDGDLALALAAYNAGPNRVATQGRVPDLPETKAYVTRILSAYQSRLPPGSQLLLWPRLLMAPPGDRD